jgi:hypothetical protein
MGWMDRLRAMFGGSAADEQAEDTIEQDFAAENVHDDVEAERLAAIERAVDSPSSIDDER